MQLGAAALAAPVGREPGENSTRAIDQFIRGTVADQMQDYYRAVYHYQEALRFDSTSAFIQVALAQDYILLGDPNRAADLLEKALRTRPDYRPALELKAVLMRGTEDFARARDALRSLVQLDSLNAQYLRQLLSVELSLENFNDADQVYERIVGIEGESDLLTRQVLAVYLTSGETDRAIRLIQKLVDADSTDAGLVYTLGTTYLAKGDTTRGTELIYRANRMEPDEPRFWTGRVVLAMDREDFEGAITLADSAIALAPDEAALYSLKGTAENRLGRAGDAVATLGKAIELDSTQFVAMGTLALIYDRMDSVTLAADLYERAIRLSDSSAIYLNNLAYTWASRGIELARAKVLAERALERDPENGAYHDTMGWILFGLGKHNEALRWLKQAIRLSPDSPDILEHLGDVYLKKGSRSKARSYYERSLKLDPTNEHVRQKLAR